MTRSQRKRLVAAIGIGLLGLFVGLIGVPAAAVLLMPTSDISNAADFNDAFMSWHQTAQVVNFVSFASLAVAALCLVYTLAALARWFIASAPE